jgi:pimeloyl-ACP methyl ester carboxylesterase
MGEQNPPGFDNKRTASDPRHWLELTRPTRPPGVKTMATTPANGPTVVLVHGAWADGSSWRRVIPILLKNGIPVVAVQNPTTSLADDVTATRRALDAVKGPVVLVGHSWGGAVITEAGNDPKVKALVYVAAFAPDAGETVGEAVGRYPSPPGLAHISDDGAGFLTLSAEGWVTDVGPDLPEEEARVLAVLQPPLAASTFGDKITEAAWATRPNWYIVSTDDRVVSVELEREYASAMKAKTIELKSSHLSLLSMPDEVAKVILEAVESTAAS